jgi:hypothetical protein
MEVLGYAGKWSASTDFPYRPERSELEYSGDGFPYDYLRDAFENFARLLRRSSGKSGSPNQRAQPPPNPDIFVHIYKNKSQRLIRRMVIAVRLSKFS